MGDVVPAFPFRERAEKPNHADPHARGYPVPVFRPRLPDAERLLPYLQRIDSQRIYSNRGPLADEFVQRLAALLDLPQGSIAATASGHAALVGAILAHADVAWSERPLALIPAFTFASTALAAEQCGYKPYLVDVDAETWQLDPEALLRHPELHRAGLVLPVAPYGTAIDIARWEGFQRKSRVPVVVDAAAGFAAFEDGHARAGSVPVVLSFHATKCFSTGEGGGVLCTNAALIERVVQAINFGFMGDRNCAMPAFNGKLSEYHAAVGLAQLDEWPKVRAAWARVAKTYSVESAGAGIGANLLLAPDVGANHAFHCAPSAEAAANLARGLGAAGIDTRFWYGGGLHRHTHFAGAPRDSLPVTEEACSRMIGLPMAIDLEHSTIHRVVNTLSQICASGRW